MTIHHRSKIVDEPKSPAGEKRSSAAVIPTPPLESGDRLTREEFEPAL